MGETPSSSIEELVTAIGDEVVDTQTVGEDENEAKIYACQHGDSVYRITDVPGHPYYEIAFVFRLVGAIANRLDDDTVKELTGEEPERGFSAEADVLPKATEDVADEEPKTELVIAGENGSTPSYEAAKEVLKEIDDEVMDRFGYNLFQELSNPMVAITMRTLDDGSIELFEVSRKIFPEDEGFSLTEFNNSVQAVISKGVFGRNMVSSTLLPQIELPEES